MELEKLFDEMKKIMRSKNGMNIPLHWWKAIFDIVEMAWEAAEKDG